MYRASSDKSVQIKSPDDYTTLLHALEKKTAHRAGGRISFVSLFEDEIQSAGADKETIEPLLQGKRSLSFCESLLI